MYVYELGYLYGDEIYVWFVHLRAKGAGDIFGSQVINQLGHMWQQSAIIEVYTEDEDDDTYIDENTQLLLKACTVCISDHCCDG